MSTGIPSHDLAAWTQARISAIYEAQSDTDFQKAFSSAFSSSPDIFINHQNISKDDMKDDIAKRRNAAACGMDVKWENVMVVPKDSAKPDEAGIVAGFLVVNRSLKYRIRAAPAQMQTVLNISAKIDQDPVSEADEHGDRRRIVHLFMTSVERRPPIHFQTPPESATS